MTNARPVILKTYISKSKANLASNGLTREMKLIMLGTLLHLPLGVLLYSSSALALLHPLIVFFLGLRWALRKHTPLIKVAYVCAYIIGAEVLWRMAGSPIFWEFGKYGTLALMFTALFVRSLFSIPKFPLFYFVLLIPGCLLTFFTFTLSQTRDLISGTMSGPLLLFVCCWFFSNLKVTPVELRRLLVILIIPIVTIACTTLFYTVTTEVTFNTESNFATSGGFGPNQVSTALGLGTFVAVFCYIVFKNNRKIKLYLALLALFMAMQSVMTFSRSGVYNAIGAIIFVFLLQFQNITEGIKRLLPVVLLVVLFVAFIFPALDSYTGGYLQARFEETGTSNRSEILESDLQLLMESPVMGTGVGISKYARAEYFGSSASSHTEFSRLIAEHGSFGILVILILILMTILNFKRQKTNLGKSLVVGFVVWSVFYMFNSGMRLGAPSLIWGFTFITIISGSLNSKNQFHPRKLKQLPLVEPNKINPFIRRKF